MERIAIDILGPLTVTDKGNKYILVIADYFSKWTEAFPMPDQEASTVADLLVKEVMCRFGVPLLIYSDQGRNLESALFSEVCQLLGIKKTRTTANHPSQMAWWKGLTGHFWISCPSLLITTRRIGISTSLT